METYFVLLTHFIMKFFMKEVLLKSKELRLFLYFQEFCHALHFLVLTATNV